MVMDNLQSPPSAVDIESSLLAGCLVNPVSLTDIVDELHPDDFYLSKHQLIWKAIKTLSFFKEPVELVTVAQSLNDSGKLDAAGGASYLAKLTNNIPLSTDMEYHARIIKEKRALRKSIEVANAIIKRAYSDDPAVDTVDYMHQECNSIEVESTSKDLKGMDELAEESADQIDTLQTNPEKLIGVHSGFHGIDDKTNGNQKGDLIIIAARPSMGKTSMAINMAKTQASKGVPVAVFSLEQPARQLFNRMLSDVTNIDSTRFHKGRFTDNEIKIITAAQGRLWQLPIYIDDKGSLTIHEICARARRYKKRHDVQVIYLDHLQLTYAGTDFRRSRNDELGYITSRLKGLAKDLDVTVVCLSQLNRQLENRPNPHKRPRLSDLRDSGNIEQDADIVEFIYRPEVYGDKDSEKWPGFTELILAKHRNGPTGVVELTWEKEFTRFRETTTYYGDQPI
jgi:replicative DNA helicase